MLEFGITLIFTIIIIIIVIVSVIASKKCPKCKKLGLVLEKTVEKERYNTTKNVEDVVRNKDGKVIKTVEKTIPITKVVYEKYYKCQNCGQIVVRYGEKEL